MKKGIFGLSLFCLYLAVFSGSAVPELKFPVKPVVLITVEGEIHGTLKTYLKHCLAEAKKNGARGIILKINTPGGEAATMLDMIEVIHDAGREMPIAGWVVNKSLSAGTGISLACSSIYMQPRSVIGASAVIVLGMGGGDDDKNTENMIQKSQSAIRETYEGLVKKPELKPLVAAMVEKDLGVVQVSKDGQTYFLSDKEYRDLEKQVADGKKPEEDLPKLVKSVREAGKLVTLTGEEAASLGLTDGTCDTLPELCGKLGITPADVTESPFTWTEKVAFFLAQPMVRGILVALGLLGIYLEFKTPGVLLPGIVGGICFIIVLFSNYLVGLAEVFEILMFFSGIILILAEIFVIPGFGVPGLAGILLVILSLFLSSQDFVWPVKPTDFAQLSANLYGFLTGIIVFCGLLLVAVRYMHKLPWIKWAVLPTTVPQAAEMPDFQKYQALRGKVGEALTTLRPAGMASFDGERIDVVSQGEFIEPGHKVEVIEVEGKRIVVKEQGPA